MSWKNEYQDYLNKQGVDHKVGSSNSDLLNKANANRDFSNAPGYEDKLNSTSSYRQNRQEEDNNHYQAIDKQYGNSYGSSNSQDNTGGGGGGYLNSINKTLGKEDTAGRTLASSGYGQYYSNQLKEYEDNLAWSNKVGDNYAGAANHKSYLQQQIDQNKNGAHNDFMNWDVGHVQKYADNKMQWESASPEERKRLEAINQQLRDFYDMKEDKWDVNAMGELKSQLLWGDFINFGLNKEDRDSIPAIGSSSETVDPKFRAAEMFARRDELFGYEPLGRAVGDRADERRDANYRQEAGMINQLGQNGTMNNPANQEFSFQEKQFDMQIGSEVDEFLSSNGKAPSGKTEVKSSFSLNGNKDESIIHTSNGYFVKSEGKMIEIDEDQYTNMMLELNGFDTSTPYSSKQAPKSDVSSGINPSTNPTINNSTINKGASNVPVSPRDTQTNTLFQSNKARTFAENNPEHVAKITPFVDSARSMLGSIYSQPKRMKDGYADCSSLVGRAMKMAGITDDSFVTTATMITDNRFQYISKAEAMPGDIMWEKGHVGILLDNGKVLEASGSKGKVVEQNLGKRFTGAYRIKT